jgi:hypothetical protein
VGMPDGMPDGMLDGMPDGMPDGLPVELVVMVWVERLPGFDCSRRYLILFGLRNENYHRDTPKDTVSFGSSEWIPLTR